ncbi:putative ABC transporter permease [Indibacter alkaliphilus LW1]|uniref:ABC transporter permease n=1 Tax=Indibacter alkaliphilus (strain CCUG 57479 / KCTC 22604 / LW1) TaxID=1189612 RepID=S2DFV8_INDAL|nr:ABC transporter permease [Indibacter alkaliphilus]EOZ97824.1 putative ABC transporter permease [Indibacter alkaliphilus LW1]
MLFNYLKIAWRTLFRHKLSSFLYITGLSLALLSVIFIGIYVYHEKSFDSFLPELELIHRVNLDGKMGPEEFLSGNTPPPVGQALLDNFPEVKEYTRMYRNSPGFVSHIGDAEKKVFKETRLFTVDSNFVSFFDFPLLEGDGRTALKDRYSLVLTESTGKKYFGDESPIGKQLQLDEWTNPFVVSAVLKDLPSNSSIQFDILIPNESNPAVKRFEWSWVWLQMNTFVKLHLGATSSHSLKQLEDKMPSLVKTQAAEAFHRIGKPLDQFLEDGGRWNLSLQPMSEIHLGSKGIYSSHISHGNPTTVNAFFFTAIMILAMACINCMNLTTAYSLRRSKEIGVKKVLGTGKRQLIIQFLTESALSNTIAAILALAGISVLLPYFNKLTGKFLQMSGLFNASFIGVFFILIIFTTLFAGLYPAFYLSNFRSLSIIKRNANPKSIFSEHLTRNFLIVFQFVISAALILSSIVVFQQIKYAGEINMGFDKEHVLLINHVEKSGKDQKTITEELRKLPGVQSASLNTGVPGKNAFGDFYVPVNTWEESNLLKDLALASYMVDEEYLNTMGIELISGRNFSRNFNDSTSVLLNEKAARLIGWSNEEAIGNFIRYPGRGNQQFEVIGILKDFHVESIHTEIIPFALFHFTSQSYYPQQLYISIRLDKENIEQTMAGIEKLWLSLEPEVIYESSFVEEDIEAMYQSDKRSGITFWVFTLLAILIGGIGLFGLVTATIQQRVRELGVRKVLGASSLNLVQMLSGSYFKLIVIAFIIAIPLATWSIGFWLEQFAYRIDVHIGYFLTAFLIGIGFSVPFILIQTWKAATSNPVDALHMD